MTENDTAVLSPHPIFDPGQIRVGKEARAVLSERDISDGIHRHVRGDWGDVHPLDLSNNQKSLAPNADLNGTQTYLFSAFDSASGVRFFIVTEWHRCFTTVVTPQDYRNRNGSILDRPCCNHGETF